MTVWWSQGDCTQSFRMCIDWSMTVFDSPSVTLCGWQRVEMQLLPCITIYIIWLCASAVPYTFQLIPVCTHIALRLYCKDTLHICFSLYCYFCWCCCFKQCLVYWNIRLVASSAALSPVVCHAWLCNNYCLCYLLHPNLSYSYSLSHTVMVLLRTLVCKK